jgi:hypothetical protein
MSKVKRKKFADDVDTSTGGELQRFRPSHIRSNHAENQRLAPYDAPDEIAQWLVPPGVEYEPGMRVACCFTLEQIEARLKSLLTEGQINPVEVSMSGTKYPDLEVGNLRQCGFLLAEARGLLDQIPRAKGTACTGIKAIIVPRAKSQAERATKARRNRAENNEHQALSPVDHGLFFKRELEAIREDGTKKTVKELAAEEGCSVDYINKHVRLFKCLTPPQLLEVHEGKVPMSIALRRASKAGTGGNTGPRGSTPAIKHSAMQRALANVETRKPPSADLSHAQVLALLARLAGTQTSSDDELVESWIDFADADKSVGKPAKVDKPSKPKKLAPPTTARG